MIVKKIGFYLGYFLSCLGILFSVNSYIAYENHSKGEVASAFVTKDTRIEIGFENEDFTFSFPESNVESFKFNLNSSKMKHSMFYMESYVNEYHNPFIGDEDVKVLIYDRNVDNYFGVNLTEGNYPTKDQVIVSREFADKYNIISLPAEISFSKMLNGEISEDSIVVGGIFDSNENKYTHKPDKNGREATDLCIISYDSENFKHFGAFICVFEFLTNDDVTNSFLLPLGLSMIGGVRSFAAYEDMSSMKTNKELSNILSTWYSDDLDKALFDCRAYSITIFVLSLIMFVLLSIWFFVKRTIKTDIFMVCLVDLLISLLCITFLNKTIIGGKALILISNFSSLIFLAQICLIFSIILITNLIVESKQNIKRANDKTHRLSRRKKGLVSIIIPSYNGGKYLSRAIDSALNQTYKNIEIIVVNDGSKDGGITDRIAEKYKDKIIYIKKENGGVSTALNLGIQKASGYFINWLSHDDELKPTSIEERMKLWIMYGNDEKVIVGSSVSFINEQDEVITRVAAKSRNIKDISDLLKSTVNGCSLLIPKMAFENHKFTDGVIYMPDYYMWAELLNDGYSFINVPLKLVNSRIHSEQITLKHIDLLEKDFEEFFANYIECKFGKNKHKELRKIMMILKRRSHLHPFYKKYIDKIINNLKETNHFDFWDKLELGINHLISWSVFIARKVMSK